MSQAAALRVLHDAVALRIFPAAVAEVGDHERPLWADAVGHLTFEEDAPPATLDTVFDLASLTKPIVTTTIVMDLVVTHRLGLDELLRDAFADWRGTDRAMVMVSDLLEHASGLPARLVDAPPELHREFEHEICTMPLEYAPRTQSIYSDLGFIILGFLAEARGGAGLDVQFEAIRRRLEIQELLTFSVRFSREVEAAPVDPAGYHLRVRPANRIAPTMPLAEDRRKRLLVGEVHDNYADALGGVAGHAGLFGTAASVGAFARLVLRAARGDAAVGLPLTPPVVDRFTRRSHVPGSSRALGWDTMLPTSSCGVHMSREAFGHVGYTGTSLWIDPRHDRYFVLLTNRACKGGTLDQIRDVRRAFHDAWR